MMDTSGNILNSYIYDPYGVVMSQTEGTYNPFKYAGELQDMSSGLIYLRNRYYDPSIGRFLTEDPIKDGTNWYMYCENNPVNFWDPSGYITQEEIYLYKNGYLDEDVYNILMDLTQRYNIAETQDGRDEIHRLAERFRNNNYRYVDLTKEANKQLWDNGLEISVSSTAAGKVGYVMSGIIWYSLVDNGGDWDYKVKKADWMPQDENMDYFMFFGKLISIADYGNINYGYTGTILKLHPETLYKGAGYIQSGTINNNPYEYYGDSEVDYYNVQKGIRWANSLGYKGYIPLPVKELIDMMGVIK